MTRSKHVLTRLGLWAMAMGLMAVFPAAGQAANWMVKGATLKEGLAPQVQIKEIEGGAPFVLSMKNGAVKFSCAGANLIGIALEPEGKLSNGGKIEFTKCILGFASSLGGTLGPLAGCEPSTVLEGGKIDSGVVVTQPLRGELVLHEVSEKEKIGLVRIEPKSGELFASINLGEECAIGEEIPIFGKLTLEDNELETEHVDHLITGGPLSNLWIISNTPEHAISLGGKAILSLAGAHTGLTWSGLPE